MLHPVFASPIVASILNLKRLIYYLLFLIYIIILVGCGTTDTDTNTKNDIALDLSTIILTEKNSLPNDSATVVKEFDVKAGYYYQIHTDAGSFKYDIEGIVISSSGDTITDGFFKSSVTGKFQIVVSVEELEYDDVEIFTYTLNIIELKPLPEWLSGKWILKKTIFEFDGNSSIVYYDENKCLEVIEINNDYLYEYSYDDENDSIEIDSDLVIDSWFFEKDIKHNNMKDITVSMFNSYGSETLVFEKFSGLISDVVWEDNNEVIVPSNIIGNWYLSYDYEFEQEGQYEIGQKDKQLYIETGESDTTYLSAKESKIIIEIRSDSLITYYKRDNYQVDIYSTPISERYSFFKIANVVNGTLVLEETVFEMGADDWEGEHSIERYEKYSGTLPTTNSWVRSVF